MVKDPPSKAGDECLVLGSERSPGEGNGNPLQLSCLGKSHGQRSLMSYSSWAHKRVGQNLVTKQQQILKIDNQQGSTI